MNFQIPSFCANPSFLEYLYNSKPSLLGEDSHADRVLYMYDLVDKFLPSSYQRLVSEGWKKGFLRYYVDSDF